MYIYENKTKQILLTNTIEKRDKMSMAQYFDCYLKMLTDDKAILNGSVNDYLVHLQQVAEDARDRPWSRVRAWSQHVLDKLESGDMTWQDNFKLFSSRNRMVYVSEEKHSEFLSDCVSSLLSLEPRAEEGKIEAKYRLLVAHMCKS